MREFNARFRFAQHGNDNPQQLDPHMPRSTARTVRKLTCWRPDEWARIEDAIPAAGVPALRFVREAALEKADALRGCPPPMEPPSPPPPAAPPARRTRAHPHRTRPAGDELVHQLRRVLNNLQQLRRVAEIDGDSESVFLIVGVMRTIETATVVAPERGTMVEAFLAELVPAGIALNDVARSANGADYLPPDAEEVIARVFNIVRRFRK